jgi:hypothetical protein
VPCLLRASEAFRFLPSEHVPKLSSCGVFASQEGLRVLPEYACTSCRCSDGLYKSLSIGYAHRRCLLSAEDVSQAQGWCLQVPAARDAAHGQQGMQLIRVKWLKGVEPCPKQEALFASSLADIVTFVENVTRACITDAEREQGLGKEGLQVVVLAPCLSAVLETSCGCSQPRVHFLHDVEACTATYVCAPCSCNLLIDKSPSKMAHFV